MFVHTAGRPSRRIGEMAIMPYTFENYRQIFQKIMLRGIKIMARIFLDYQGQTRKCVLGTLAAL